MPKASLYLESESPMFMFMFSRQQHPLCLLVRQDFLEACSTTPSGIFLQAADTNFARLGACVQSTRFHLYCFMANSNCKSLYVLILRELKMWKSIHQNWWNRANNNFTWKIGSAVWKYFETSCVVRGTSVLRNQRTWVEYSFSWLVLASNMVSLNLSFLIYNQGVSTLTSWFGCKN